MKMGRNDEAINACREAIRLRPDFKEAYNNLGLALKKKGDLEQAIGAYEEAVRIDGEYAEALSNLGMALIAQGRLAEAAGKLRKAADLAPNSAEICNNLGVLFNRQGRFEEAVSASERAISIRGDYVEAHNNLGTALMELERFSEAEAAFARAIQIDSECAESHHNRALVLLLTGQFEEGWEGYERRWRHSGFNTPMRPFGQPWWDGSVERLGKLLVWGEQGVGDEIYFSALIRHIVSRGIDVVVECDRRLAPLLQRSFGETVVVGRTEPPSFLPGDPSITHQIPMASIPHILGMSPDSMDFQEPFLLPDRELRERFRREYKGDGNFLLAGISWKSGNRQEGQKRSVGLEQWGAIFKSEGVRFVNLQYGECSRELQEAHERFGVEIIDDARVDSLRELESFAAQSAAMDVVISVDNSTVHFAGAMGVKVWTMLPTSPDWRWGLEGDRTRWYPTMRLFRQEERGNWKPVISRVAAKLALLARTGEER
jgi:Tfp pilus assembly protein PilF